jgi:hypothetical protein
VSFLKDEFTHHNGEAMLVVRDGNSQNFYFFIGDRLWKWYKAFDAAVFEGQPFDQFAAALQGRFGDAEEKQGALREGAEERRWLEWHHGDARAHTRLRAVDENEFFGFYCLVFENMATVDDLPNLRTNRGRQRRQGHAMVDAVTSDDSEASTANQDVVDRITGQIRRRTNAPEENEDGGED